MRIALLVDYANLFHSIRKDAAWSGDANEGAVQALERLERYLEAHPTRCLREPEWVARHVFLLDERRLRPAVPALQRLGLETTVVALRRKTDAEISLRASADDDAALKEAGLRLCPHVDALVLVSNDGDYLSLAEAIHHEGRRLLVAAYETQGARLGAALRRAADEVLPLRDILLETDEPEPLPVEEEEAAEPALDGPSLDVYFAGRRLLSFPLDRDETEIGRRSVRLAHFPHLDLTDHDAGRIVSRKHLRLVRLAGGRFLLQVHPTCSRPTWVACEPIQPGESVVLSDGKPIVVGDPEGFALLPHLAAASAVDAKGN